MGFRNCALFVFAILSATMVRTSNAWALPSAQTPSVSEASCSGPMHAKRTWETPELASLYRAIVSLKAGEAPDFFSERVLSNLKEYGELNDTDQLADPETQNRLFANVSRALAERDHLNAAAGSIAAPVRISVQRPSPNPDRLDMLRGFGWRFLRDDDPIFNEPEYSSHILSESGATGAGMAAVGSSPSGALRAFADEWQRNAPSNVPAPNAFTLTGTEANNLLYEVATDVARYRMREADGYSSMPSTVQGNILVFGNTYRGTNGRIHDVPPELELPKCTVPHWGELPDQVLAHAIENEDRAIRMIEEKAADPNQAIGGVFLELVTSQGVEVYRPEFALRLRKTCDRLGLPIYDDEVMSGGGRTGHFFAYQHYEGFEPDFVTFGKGLIVAGVARVERFRKFYLPNVTTIASTLTNHNELFWKSAQIMKRLRTGNLIQNAAEVGAYLVSRLREDSAHAHGVGLMIYGGTDKFGAASFGRILPYLSMSREDVDEVLGPPAATKASAPARSTFRHF